MEIPVTAGRKRKTNNQDLKRTAARDELWPGSAGWFWDPGHNDVKGFATMSRLMPWILLLIRDLAGKGINPSGAYLDLWCRDFGQGLVEIKDEEECAFAAGYRGQRGVRTWREHMQRLVELHFIKVEAKGNREFAFVLLLDPLAVARWYKDQGKTPPGWWTSFSDRAREISAVIPPALDPASTSAPASVVIL
jgi:hypothetical protein